MSSMSSEGETEGNTSGGEGETEEDSTLAGEVETSRGREEVEEGEEASVEEIGSGTEGDGENIPGEIEDWITSEVNRGISSSVTLDATTIEVGDGVTEKPSGTGDEASGSGGGSKSAI